MIPTTNTAILNIFSLITFEYCIINLIAMSLSEVTNIRWRHEAVINMTITLRWTFSTVLLLLRPSSWIILHRTYDGWLRTPVNTSITARQARKMLLLVGSRSLVFTACITRTLSRTVKGQAIMLMMLVIIKLSSSGTSTLAELVIFEAFPCQEKFDIFS